MVAPHVGAWIETMELPIQSLFTASPPTWGRGLKLLLRKVSLKPINVAPHVGAWIETTVTNTNLDAAESPPTWGRGLKL